MDPDVSLLVGGVGSLSPAPAVGDALDQGAAAVLKTGDNGPGGDEGSGDVVTFDLRIRVGTPV